MTSDDAPSLVREPIREVVCGVRFKPLPAFDTLHHGLFWSRIRDRFGRAETRPLLTDPAVRIRSDVPLQRSWFVSTDEQFVIQVQLDRFYVNWRKRGQRYPRFHGDDGVYARFERELDGFRLFLRNALDVVPEVQGIELAKVDVLEHPTDWTDIDDLGVMIPRLKSAVSGKDISRLDVNLRSNEKSEGELRQLAFRTGGEPGSPHVHSEFRVTAAVRDGASTANAFALANRRVNEMFFTELPDARRRFGTRVQ